MRYIISLALVSITLSVQAQICSFKVDRDNANQSNIQLSSSLNQKLRYNPVNDVMINFNNAIPFDGVEDFLIADPDLNELEKMTVISVFQPATNASRTLELWSIQPVTADAERTIDMSINSINTNRGRQPYEGIESGKAAIHTYAQNYQKNSRGGAQERHLSLGMNQEDLNANFHGKVGELLIFDRVLGESELQKITSSLALKYGICLKEQNYISSDDQIIWDYEQNKTYNNRITGIGFDKLSGLAQKQSTSSDDPDFLTIGFNKIADSNKENLAKEADLQFMLWGDNNLSTAFPSRFIINKAPVMPRKWLAYFTGLRDEKVFTQLRLNATSILNEDITSLTLAIDETGTGNFDLKNTRFVKPSSVVKGIITFDNIVWDKNQSGQEVFSFVNTNNPLVLKLEQPTELLNNEFVRQFEVQPNLSADGNYAIRIELKTEKKALVRVFDAAGKLISRTEFKNDRSYFLNNQFIEASGLYNVVLNIGDYQFNKKLIIQ